MTTASAPPEDGAPGALARRARGARRRRVAAVVLLLLGLVLFGLVRWLGSEAALRWAVEQAVEAAGGRLSLERPEGTLFGVVRVGRVLWHDGPLTVAVDDASVSIGWRALLSRRLHLHEVSARHVEVVTEPVPDAAPAAMPQALRL
jgi:translocation and assembly module TamB